MESDNCKLVCLSGTPIVNRPSEIALLINMLKGQQKVFTFKLDNMSEDEYTELKRYMTNILLQIELH